MGRLTPVLAFSQADELVQRVSFRDFRSFELKRPSIETVSGGSRDPVSPHFALARRKALFEALRSH